MSTTTAPAPSVSQTFTSSPPNGSGSKLIIIIVSCVGGFIVALIAVCIIVPLLRRRVARRASRDLEDTSSPAHGRNVSEAGAPLLSTKSHNQDPSDNSLDVNGTQDSHDHPGIGYEIRALYPDLEAEQARPTSPSTTASHSGSTLYNPWNSPSLPSKSTPSTSVPVPRAPPGTLRHARTRIRSPIMAPVPEDNIPSPELRSPPLPPTPTDVTENTSWLRIPSTTPLITAFRRSVAASTSSRATSAASLSRQSSAQALPKRSSDAMTFQTFTSGASSGHTPPLPAPPDLKDIPMRLRPSDPARVAQLVPGPLPGGGPGSRAASVLSATGQSGSRSELSVYTDARSNFDVSELGERL